MKRFQLNREEDESGVSGVGHIAEGVMYSDGTCSLRWRTRYKSTAVYPDMETLMRIHGHNGATQLEWIDKDVTTFGKASNTVFDRGCCDCMQDAMENAHCASIKSRNYPKAPVYIDEEDIEEYLRGYTHRAWTMWGDDWRTCEF